MASGLYSELFTLVISLINRFVSSECYFCSCPISPLVLQPPLFFSFRTYQQQVWKIAPAFLNLSQKSSGAVEHIVARTFSTFRHARWKNRGHGQSFRANAGCYPDPSIFIIFISTPPSLFVLLRALKSSQHSLCSLLIVDTPGFQNPRLAQQQQRGATFEELCHNYTQERLQTLFHERTFVREMERYKEVPLVPRMTDTRFGTFCQRLGCFLFMPSPRKSFNVFIFNFRLQKKNKKTVGQGDRSTEPVSVDIGEFF